MICVLYLGDDGLAVGDDEVDGVAHDDLKDGALVLVRHYAHHQNLHAMMQYNALIYAEAKIHIVCIVSLHNYWVFHQLKDMRLG